MIYFNADDYGVTDLQSKHIRETRTNGRLTGVSAMPNAPYLEKAMSFLDDDPDLRVAVHINLTEGIALSDPKDIPLLVNEQGRLSRSFFSIFAASLGSKKKQLLVQIKKEIRLQIARVKPLIKDRPLRLDGHQHIQMIPIVMKAIVEVVEEDGLKVDYMRYSAEPITPYLKHLEFIKDYSLINLIKNIVLNVFGWYDKKYMDRLGLSRSLVIGLVISGNLEYRLISVLLPDFEKIANKKHRDLELVMHPGYGIERGESLDVVDGPFEQFYLSKGRKREYDCLLKI